MKPCGYQENEFVIILISSLNEQKIQFSFVFIKNNLSREDKWGYLVRKLFFDISYSPCIAGKLFSLRIADFYLTTIVTGVHPDDWLGHPSRYLLVEDD